METAVKAPRIVVMTTSYPRSERDDASIFIQRLVNAFDQLGLSGSVIVPFDRAEPLLEQQGGFTIRRFKYGLLTRGQLLFGGGGLPNLRRKPWLVLQIPALFISMLVATLRASREADLLFANWIFAGVVACCASWITGKPYVVALRGEDIKLVTWRPFQPVWRLVAQRAAKIVTVNKGFHAMLKTRGLPESKLVFIPNGVAVSTPHSSEVTKFTAEHQLTTEGRYLSYVGRVYPVKQIEQLVELLAKPELHKFQLILCGRLDDAGYKKQLLEQAQKLGVSSRVRVLGSIPPNQINCLLEISNYVLSASSHEGRPNSLMEAMSAGKVVLASNIPAHRELIEHGRNGFIFSTVEECAALIAQLEGNQELSTRVSGEARASLAESTWERSAHSYLNTFLQTVKS